MVFWSLFLLLSNLSLSLSASVEDISAHVHVAASDQMVVCANNRNGNFRITLSPYETPAVLHYLNYPEVETNTVRSLVIPTKASPLGLIELVFIGERSNSSEMVLFHARLQLDENSQYWSVVHLVQNSIASLSSVGVECALGIHPRGTHVFVVGDRAGLVYDMNETLVYNWSWSDQYSDKRYPKAISVTEDDEVIVGVYLQWVDKIYPGYFRAKFYSKDNINPLSKFTGVGYSVIPNIRAPMSMTVRGSIHGDDFIMAIGFPSMDSVFLSYTVEDGSLVKTMHQSAEKGVKFGQAVIITANNTYGVLSSALATSPWSTGRIQFYPIPTNNSSQPISPSPLFVYPNNQQHFPYHSSINPSPFDIVSIFSWIDGFGAVISLLDSQYTLLVPASPPGDLPIYGFMYNYFSIPDIVVLSPDRCMPGTYKSEWGSSPCQLCPPRTLNNGSSGAQCDPCDDDDGSSWICFRGASHKMNRQRLVDREQVDGFPVSPDSSQFDDVLLNHVFKLGSTSNLRCLIVAPMFWGFVAIGLGVILFLGILLLGRFSKLTQSQTFIKSVFTHLDLIGEGQLWLGGLVTLAIIALVTLTCKFSISFSDLYPIDSVSLDARESISCDSSLINAKFSSSLQLLSTRKHPEEKPIFDLLDEQNITLTVEFISTGFQCPSVSLQEKFARGEAQEIDYFNCSYDKDDEILLVSTVLPQHLITAQVNLEGPFVVGGLRVCLSGPNTAIDNGRYAVQSLDFCHFVYTPNEVLSLNTVTNIEMTKIINRTAANSVDAESRETFSGIWLPTWTTDKSSLWDSHIYKKKRNEYRRSLSWRLSLIVEMRQSKFYMNNIQEPIARGYEIVFKTVLFSMLFLDLFGLLFLIVKVLFVPLLRLIRQKVSCCSTRTATKSATPSQKDPDGVPVENPTSSHIDLSSRIGSKNSTETTS